MGISKASIAACFCLTFAAILPATAFSCRAAVFRPETFTLANGMQIVVVRNRLSPAVAQMVWYKVGAADEEEGKSGLAHYLEHLMFRGTPVLPAGSFSRSIAANGGRDNAFTSHDYTAYHEIVSAERLPEIMWMEADRMRNLAITEETAAPELGVILNERHERTDNSPQGRFAEKMSAALFPSHPYGRPIIGWRSDLEALKPADAVAFYGRHYRPDNAVAVISGNVETREVMRLAAATFGAVKPDVKSTAPRAAIAALPAKASGERRVVAREPDVKQAVLNLRRLAPSYATQNGREAYAWEVLAEALGGGESGVLYRDFVLRRGSARAIEAAYDPQSRGAAEFNISAVPATGYDPEKLSLEINSELARLAERGLSAREVADARERLERSAIFARDSLLAPGYAFGMALTTGVSIKEVEAWPKRIAAVKTAEVNAALRDLAKTPRRVDGFLLPEGEAK